MNAKSILLILIALCIVQVADCQKKNKKSDKPISITGRVLNSENNPITGATIYLDNIRTSNITNSYGVYKIKVSPSVVKLEVRSSEYGSCVTEINGQRTINFTLDGENSKTSLTDTGNQGDIDDQNIKSSRSRGTKINTYNDIYQMIRGEVSGVVVSGRSVLIQQGKSFFGSTTPLFVINGVIVASIDNVNPLEVRSIKVLKGSSAAIYGVRGANGVISIDLINGTEKEKQ